MSAAEESLRKAIERSYPEFESISRPQKLRASPLRDADEILHTLTSVPLRQLTGEQVGPYSGWALTTVGGDRDYRYFLPRILELAVTDPVWLGTEPPIIASKLKMADWRKWPAGQQKATLDVFRTAFAVEIERHPDDSRSAGLWVCGLILLGDDALRTFETWLSASSPNAALQLAGFLNDEAKALRKHQEIRGPFWEEVDGTVRRELANMLTSDRVAAFLQAASGKITDEDRCYILEPALGEVTRQAHGPLP